MTDSTDHPARNPLELLPADGDAIDEARSLLAAVFEEVGLKADVPRLTRLPGELRAGGGEWWVCSMKDAVVGAVGLRAGAAPGEGELCWWGVVPARRGMGLGRWMAQKALEHARRRAGMKTVSATVTPAMRRAAAVLLDLGFRAPEGFDPELFDAPTTLLFGAAAVAASRSTPENS